MKLLWLMRARALLRGARVGLHGIQLRLLQPGACLSVSSGEGHTLAVSPDVRSFLLYSCGIRRLPLSLPSVGRYLNLLVCVDSLRLGGIIALARRGFKLSIVSLR
jgi:hypothetical protein